MITVLLVGVLGGAGAAARWAVDSILTRHGPRLPISTCVINIVGSFLLGLLVAAGAGDTSSSVLVGLGVGFCGGFTTFSTATVETVRTARQHSLAAGALHLVVMVLGSVGAALVGLLVGQGLA